MGSQEHQQHEPNEKLSLLEKRRSNTLNEISCVAEIMAKMITYPKVADMSRVAQHQEHGG